MPDVTNRGMGKYMSGSGITASRLSRTSFIGRGVHRKTGAECLSVRRERRELGTWPSGVRAPASSKRSAVIWASAALMAKFCGGGGAWGQNAVSGLRESELQFRFGTTLRT